jgi:hypothetical protein
MNPAITCSTRLVVLVALATSANAGALLNEIYVNPPSTDDAREYVEIARTSAADTLANVWLLEIDGDGSNAGSIDTALDLSAATFGANGLAWIGSNYATSGPPWPNTSATKVDLTRLGDPTLENGSITFLLVSGFTGAAGDDCDTDNDGTLDTVPWSSILDSVGWLDGGSSDRVYSLASLVQSSGTPDAATRFPGDATLNSAAAWYAGDILATAGDPVPDYATDYDATKATANFPAGGALTPGCVNVPEPASLALGLALGLCGLRRRG